jgi:hypothetical protein
MSLEQLVLIAVFVLVPLLNFLVRVLGRRFGARAPAEPVPMAVPAPSSSQRASPGVRRRTVPGRSAGASSPPDSRPAGARRRLPLQLESAHAVRRAIVLMAVLGPCRGLAPPPPSMTNRAPDRDRR